MDIKNRNHQTDIETEKKGEEVGENNTKMVKERERRWRVRVRREESEQIQTQTRRRKGLFLPEDAAGTGEHDRPVRQAAGEGGTCDSTLNASPFVV